MQIKRKAVYPDLKNKKLSSQKGVTKWLRLFFAVLIRSFNNNNTLHPDQALTLAPH